MTVSAIDAQLIDQLKWTVEDVARCFHMPLFKIGAAAGQASNLSVEAQQQLYLNDCLQIQIESIELCLNEGLALPGTYSVEIDEEGLLRMDGAAKAEAWANLVKGMIAAPNEARRAFDLKPVSGGDSPLAQQQNYSLAALAKRDAKPDPFGTAKPVVDTTVPAANDAQAAADAAAKAMADVMEMVRAIHARIDVEAKSAEQARTRAQQAEDARFAAKREEERTQCAVEMAQQEAAETLVDLFIKGLESDHAAA